MELFKFLDKKCSKVLKLSLKKQLSFYIRCGYLYLKTKLLTIGKSPFWDLKILYSRLRIDTESVNKTHEVHTKEAVVEGSNFVKILPY